ncbi:stage III sporulation protein AA [Clostridium sp. MCC353]|uniref:stage III sporulation protein AA n=1 Tax=Clostridium sp. MCC353 TaxID=2592646 RepID=UPI001C023CF9|nr:stage III sporulation protein AA [Clostridium sp. MCC353]MBT9778922.1 stage III sporulation protein AA [Clostridium sp. MCC353]
MEKKDELIKIFSKNIREILRKVPVDFEQVQEIRLRVHAPLLMVYNNREYYISREGRLGNYINEAYIVTKNELRETMEYMSNYSLYAFEEEMKQGFITIQGGHRIGIAGKTIVDDCGIRTMKFISFINVRMSHQIKGCATEVLPYLYEQGEILHTLIISPPRCGKTTLLRDMIRQISNGNDEHEGITVGVIDERSEIGACYQGVPQNDLGIRTDILDCCPKAKGMMMLIRTMSPRVIAVDEIGSREDLEAMEYVMNCGCKLIATVHGSSIEDIKQKPVLRKLVQERIFERYIILNSKGRIGNIDQIYDNRGTQLYLKGSKYACS